MSFSFRTISKFCLLLVIIGFAMPMANEGDFGGFYSNSMNGFTLAKEADDAISPIFLYGLFILSIVGVITGILLLMKQNIPVILDWLTIIICIVIVGVGTGLLTGQYNLELESGFYLIIVGVAGALIFQIVSSNKKEAQENAGQSAAISIKINPSVILFVSAIAGCLVFLSSLLLGIRFINPLLLLFGLAAVIINFIALKGKKGIFALIAGILYGVLTVFAIIRILSFSGAPMLRLTIGMLLRSNISIFFIFSLLLCFVAFAKMKKEG